MPKEFTHFLIADKALAQAEIENIELGRCLRENYNIFMLGAVLCDSPYYRLPFSGGKNKFIELAKNIHTPCGEINSDFLERLAEAVAKENKEAHFAFLCGILSHHLADRNFHPFIFYFTGKYSTPSRHRFLESLIDIRLMDVIASKKTGQISTTDYLNLEKTAMLPCLKMLIRAATPQAIEHETAVISKQLWKALRSELFLSKLYSNKSLLKTLIKINPLLKGSLSPFITLFYPDQSNCNLQLLKSDFTYRDPFNGKETDANIESITQKTVDQLSSAIMLSYENLKKSKHLFDKDLENNLFKKTKEEPLEFRYSDTETIDTAMQGFLGI